MDRCVLWFALATCIAAVHAATVGWSTRTFPITTGIAHLAAVANGNEAFFAGGYSTEGGSYTRVDIYDANTDAWGLYTSALNPARSFVTGVKVGRKIVFVGGYNQFTMLTYADANVYDIDAQTWTRKQNALQVGRWQMASCVSGTKALFVDGAIDYAGNVAATSYADLYDAATDTWTPVTLPSGLKGRWRHSGAAAIGGGFEKCVIGGGEDSNTVTHRLRRADVYDFASGVYLNFTDAFASSRRLLTGVNYGSKALFIGGETDTGGCLDTIEVYDAVTGLFTVYPALLPVARSYVQAVFAPDGVSLYLAGGSTDSIEIESRVDVLNLTSGTFSAAQPLSIPRTEIGAVTVLTKIVFAGGWDSHVAWNQTDVYETSPCGGPNPCQNGGGCVVNGLAFTCNCVNRWSGATCTLAASSSALEAGSTGAGSKTGNSAVTGGAVSTGGGISAAVRSAAVSACGSSLALAFAIAAAAFVF